MKSWEFKEVSRVSFGWIWVLRRLLSLPVFLLKHAPWIQRYQWEGQALRAPRHDLSWYMVSVCLRLMDKTYQKGRESSEKENKLQEYSRPQALICKLEGKQNKQQTLKCEMTGIFTKQVISKTEAWFIEEKGACLRSSCDIILIFC